MDDKVKNGCDVFAVLLGMFTFFYENAPQIAALLSVVWLLLRIFEWGVKAYKQGVGNSKDTGD